MPIGHRHLIKFGSTEVTAVQDLQIDEGHQPVSVRAGHGAGVGFLGIGASLPRLTVTTLDLVGFLAQVGAQGSKWHPVIDLSTNNFEAWFATVDTNSPVFSAGSTHEHRTAAKGLAQLTSVTWSPGNPLAATLDIIPLSSDGATDPLPRSALAALPAITAISTPCMLTGLTVGGATFDEDLIDSLTLTINPDTVLRPGFRRYAKDAYNGPNWSASVQLSTVEIAAQRLAGGSFAGGADATIAMTFSQMSPFGWASGTSATLTMIGGLLATQVAGSNPAATSLTLTTRAALAGQKPLSW